ncbi:exodeoxyribonuclease VII large subunit [uncultured Flavonifractor sp.]|uniref:Exodeoxyribonuclease 7 large subunit n=1 Tax=Candidatus Flavonifractor intestinigallinarum TaxID=2838586 RepID=A0A9D2MKN7_9FIRM|nr:exodeoxyribonuclease VII large subunit [uncultured Flavonifractor sp.]HJB79465.1 exodeoxyribonuclease VII large subunit [Candidatus Flavonifractor intestinigallinarum]
MSNIYTVSQVNQYIKALLDRDRELTALYVRGEISNYKAYPSGHHYFSLKDGEGAIRCVMFKREAMSLRFRPENGMKVIAFGRVAVFPRDGQYQLYCTSLTPEGVGDLHLAFEQLKQKLYAEGLFDPAHKKPIPRFPKRIALITSAAGAAVRDMLRILGARWPMAEVFLLPVRVQGTEAPGELCAAIAWANRHQVADLIITGRGGGSMEDLWAFNDENVARTVYHSAIPVISAVGHEPDVTIADFVADLRAATPSNAAELAVPDQNEVAVWLRQMEGRLAQAMGRKLERARKDLDRAARCRALQDPMNYVDDKRMVLDYQREKLAAGLNAALNRERQRFGQLASKLDALSPLKVLGRGYAIPRKGDGGVVRSVSDVTPGDQLKLRVADGEISCQVV